MQWFACHKFIYVITTNGDLLTQYTQINGEVVNGLNNHTFKKIAENVKQVVTANPIRIYWVTNDNDLYGVGDQRFFG